MEPHRGTLILILGLVSLVCCNVVGPVALFMANNDLQAMRAGRMDPEGESATNVGRILAIIGTVLLVLSFFGGILLMIVFAAVGPVS